MSNSCSPMAPAGYLVGARQHHRSIFGLVCDCIARRPRERAFDTFTIRLRNLDGVAEHNARVHSTNEAPPPRPLTVDYLTQWKSLVLTEPTILEDDDNLVNTFGNLNEQFNNFTIGFFRSRFFKRFKMNRKNRPGFKTTTKTQNNNNNNEMLMNSKVVDRIEVDGKRRIGRGIALANAVHELGQRPECCSAKAKRKTGNTDFENVRTNRTMHMAHILHTIFFVRCEGFLGFATAKGGRSCGPCSAVVYSHRLACNYHCVTLD